MLATPPASPSFPSPKVTSPGLATLLSSAAFAQLPDLGFIKVTGEDRVRWLNGMVTNSIQSLTLGQGCHNFFLNAQGRIQGDATAFLLDDSILLETSSERIPALTALLDHFIIMDDVELATLPLACLLIAGPDALRIVQGIGGTPCSTPQPPPDLPAPLSLKQTAYRGEPVYLIQAHSPLVPRFEIWAGSETLAQIITELGTIPQATPADLEALRLLEGTPLFGTDIRDKDLPQETAQTRALHFAKGCYLGQEIVERIRSRGNVHRTFSGFLLTGEVPPPGTPLFAAEVAQKSPDAQARPIGEITSAALINLPSGPITLALGYLRREALAPNAALTYPGGTATPTTLPFASNLITAL